MVNTPTSSTFGSERDPLAVSLPCPRCKAQRPLELATGVVQCPRCGDERLLSEDQRSSIRSYLDQVQGLRQEARQELARHPEPQGMRLRATLAGLCMLLGGGGAILLQHVPDCVRGCQSRLLSGDLPEVIVALASGLMILALVLLGPVVMHEGRVSFARAARGRCHGCGAVLPTFQHRDLRCPLCGAYLNPAGD